MHPQLRSTRADSEAVSRVVRGKGAPRFGGPRSDLSPWSTGLWAIGYHQSVHFDHNVRFC